MVNLVNYSYIQNNKTLFVKTFGAPSNYINDGGHEIEKIGRRRLWTPLLNMDFVKSYFGKNEPLTS